MPLLGGGVTTTGGDMAPELQQKVRALVAQFEEFVERLSQSKGLRRAVVRSRLECNTVVILDRSHLWLVSEPARGGVAAILYFDRPHMEVRAEDAREVGVWELGYQDPFVIGLQRGLLESPNDQRAAAVAQAALAWVEAEERRVVTLTQLVRLAPLFGPPTFLPDPRLCFVIMPFADELTQIYQRIVKPTVEEHNLVCKRADDIRTNQAIMHNIWKSICEARLVVADLTSGNANVFYELGIAHTVGKETILISQREETRRPFDVLHLRTIIYENTATGGANLRQELAASIKAVLEPVIVETGER